jgi:hypothetical protein
MCGCRVDIKLELELSFDMAMNDKISHAVKLSTK